MEALDYGVERAVERRQAVSPDAAMTSPAMGLGLWFMGPAIGRYSTTPAKSYERVSCFIVGSDVSLRGELFGHDWTVEVASPAVESAAAAAFAEPSDAVLAADAAKEVQWLRVSLGLSMAELASLFGAKTRKAVYDWLSGSRTNKAPYIRAVRNLLEGGLPGEYLPYLRQFWNSTPNGGESLLGILKSGEPRRLDDARAALAALQGPISDYVHQITAKPAFDAPGSADSDDIYRNS